SGSGKSRSLARLIPRPRGAPKSSANGQNRNDQDAQELDTCGESESTVGPRTGVLDCRGVTGYAPNDSSSALDYIAAAWPRLPPHVREAMLTLGGAAHFLPHPLKAESGPDGKG